MTEEERKARSQTLRNRTPEQQRNVQMREAEQNRYYNDPKARSKRASAELDAKQKKSDAMKPPRAPMMDQPSEKKKANPIRTLAEKKAAKKQYKSARLEANRVLGQQTTAGSKDQSAYSEVRKNAQSKADEASKKLSKKQLDKIDTNKKFVKQNEKAFQEGKQYTAKNSSDPFTKKSSFNYTPPKKKINFARIKALGKILGRGGGRALGVAGFIPTFIEAGENMSGKKKTLSDPRF
jgi:hypothetical protein